MQTDNIMLKKDIHGFHDNDTALETCFCINCFDMAF